MLLRISHAVLLHLPFALSLYYEVAKAQQPDPLSFFPHHRGDVWQYFVYDGRAASSGVYFCRLFGNGNSITRSMILLK
jgi:hypothetical protein